MGDSDTLPSYAVNVQNSYSVLEQALTALGSQVPDKGQYVTQASLNTTLGSYTTQTALSEALSSHLTINGCTITGDNTINSGNATGIWAGTPKTNFTIGDHSVSLFGQIDGNDKMHLLIGSVDNGVGTQPFAINPASDTIIFPDGKVLKGDAFDESITTVGAVGDNNTDNTNTLVGIIGTGNNWYVPEGTYKTTSNAVLLNAHQFHGPGQFSVNGWIFPAGDITDFVNIPVPSVFPDIYTALSWVRGKKIVGDSAFCSINVADGTYAMPNPLEMTIPNGQNKLQILGNTSDHTKCVLNFDATNNKCGFWFPRGEGVFLIDGFTINGVGAWITYGVWNEQCYGAGISANLDSHVTIGSNITINKFYYGVQSKYSSSVSCGSGVTVNDAGDVGFHAFGSSSIVCTGCSSNNCAHTNQGLGFGYCSEGSSFIDCSYSSASGNGHAGFYALTNGSMWAHAGTSTGNAVGVLAIAGGRIEASNGGNGRIFTSANNSSHGIQALHGGFVACNSTVSQANGGFGFMCGVNSCMDTTVTTATGNGISGYNCYQNSSMLGDGAKAINNQVDGFLTTLGGSIVGDNMVASGNSGFGIHALSQGIIIASGASSYNNGAGNTAADANAILTM